MKNNPTCFFCYAWGKEERYKRLDYLRDQIEKKSNSEVEVILDRHNYEDNQNFEELREKIRSYDLVIVFCTPDLLEIINDREANSNKCREVAKEYKIVEERYNDNPSSVFPIIFEGTKESSLLKLFENKNARVFEEFGINITRDNKGKEIIRIPKKKQIDFSMFVGRIIQIVTYNYRTKSEEYGSTREALDRLFSLTDNTRIPDSCLVKSDLYTKIQYQENLFVVGRKGAGKSTFIQNFPKMNQEYYDNHYKQMVPLTAEAFQHEEAYSSLISKHARESTIVSQYDVLCLFWQIYFILQSIVIIAAEIEVCRIKKTDPRYRAFSIYTKRLKEIIGLKDEKNKKKYDSINSDSTPKSVFIAAVEMIDNQFRDAMKEVVEESPANSKLIVTLFTSKFNAQKIIESNFGSKETKAFIGAVRKCKRNILISLDGFDTHSEDFRIMTESLAANGEEFRNRTEYERLFFRTMIEVVTKFKYQKYNDEIPRTLGGCMDFCIVLPKDRYDQIMKDDRDSFKRQFGSMSWTAYELMELLTKRLEYLIETITHRRTQNKTNDYYERFEEALSFFKGLPPTITMNVRGNKINMSLFNYILRSSFWRPRDVISNLSSLLSRIIRIDDNKQWISEPVIKLSEEEVKLAIKDNARKIIQEEFIDEYKHVFRNLESVLNEFQGFEEQTNIHRFKEHLKNIHFDTSYAYDMEQPENKFLVLYQLGVIGLRYDTAVANEMHYLHNICFVFNSGMSPLKEFLSHKFRRSEDVSIIFNPIFARELMLNFNTRELLGNWSKEYIEENHKMKNLIHPL